MKDAAADGADRAQAPDRAASPAGSAGSPMPGEPAAGHLSRASSARHLGVASIPAVGTVAALALWGGFGLAPHAQDIAMLVIFYVLNILGMELALHRYFAHRTFKAAPSMKVALAILGSLAYMGPLMWWVAIHRLHHANADGPGDPHTPQLGGHGFVGRAKGVLHGHVGWLFDPSSARPNGWNRYANDMYRDPTLLRIHLAYDFWLLLGLLLPAAIGGLLALSWRGALLGLLWGGSVRIFLATNAIWAVNSVGHSLGGRRPFPGRDQSRNAWWLAILTLGAGWHNNHHAFPQYASTRFQRWQIDVTGSLIALLERLGLVWDVQHPDPDVIRQRLADPRRRDA
ncbi:fatty acid desaturase [Burkholderia ubonensis]|uniref:acyl-CoA desaturase n=1 Tax=Burkholderia ubonensis TaxID=101571 RepID=UPI00075621F0|nr:acyl-CoA desaturase [Burkholderia ubonensis]KVT97201.1 fatty acid desaturase [Burkholderia ubonensis]KVZ79678.1 fatty acid desaturase [Burkholderia ubonensis]